MQVCNLTGSASDPGASFMMVLPGNTQPNHHLISFNVSLYAEVNRGCSGIFRT